MDARQKMDSAAPKRQHRWTWFAATLPALFPLGLILKYGVDFPYLDEWDRDFAGMYIKAVQHQLTFADLAAQHNEHRILIPRLILLILTLCTHWNPIADMIVQWLIVCATSVGVLWLLRRTLTGSLVEDHGGILPRVALLWFLCNLLIFTPAAAENWLWGIGIVNVMPMALTIAAMVVVTSRLHPWTRTIFGATLAGLATFSSGNGLLAWPMTIAIFAWPPSKERLTEKKWQLLAWSLFCAMWIGLYFFHYHLPPDRGPKPYPTEIGPALLYFLVFLGTPFAFSGSYSPGAMAATVGAALLLALVVALAYCGWVWRKYRDEDACRRMLVWIVIGAFPVGSAAMASGRRAGLGIMQVLSSTRYVSFSLYLIVALIVLAPMIADDWRRRLPATAQIRPLLLRLPAAAMGAMLLLLLLSYPASITACQASCAAARQGKAALLLIKVLPDNPSIEKLIFPDRELPVQEAPVLNDMGYIRPRLIETNNAALIQGTDANAVASVKGQLERGGRRPNGDAVVMGWAIFLDKSRPADAVFLTCDDAQGQPIIFAFADEIGVRRDDIAQQLGDADFGPCGWVATFPFSRLPSGIKQPTLRAWALDSETGTAFLLQGSVTMHPAPSTQSDTRPVG